MRSSSQTQVTNPTSTSSPQPQIQTHHPTHHPALNPPSSPQPPTPQPPPRIRETPSYTAGLAAARGAASSTSSACCSTVTSSPPGLCSTLERAARWGRARNSHALSVACARACAVLQPAALPDSSCLQSAALVCRSASRVLPRRASASSGRGFCSAETMTSHASL